MVDLLEGFIWQRTKIIVWTDGDKVDFLAVSKDFPSIVERNYLIVVNVNPSLLQLAINNQSCRFSFEMNE